jgi:hypothetical protein
MRSVAELTLGDEPDAVPRARHLVRSALTAERPDLAADAELVISELVTNAALYGEPPVVVRVLVNRAVRLEVVDNSRAGPIVVPRGTTTMTGRGLALVAAIASRWGVDPLDAGGKVVWAVLDPDESPASAPPSLESLLDAWSDHQDDDPTTYTVRLGSVPTQFLLDAKAHIDNVVRELMLMKEGAAVRGVTLAPELAALVETVTIDFAEARTEIKRQAAAAAARGEVDTDPELQLRSDTEASEETYLEALDLADSYARAADLLTLAPPPEHRAFRRWYVLTIIDHLDALRHGRPAPRPEPFRPDDPS